MPTLSLRARLTLWYTVALVAALCLFAGYVLWGQARLGTRRLDRELDGMSATVANVIRDGLSEHDAPAAAADEARRTVALTGSAILVLDANGSPLAGSPRDLPLAGPLPTADDGPRAWTADTPTGAWRVHAQPERFDDTTLVLVVASSLVDVQRERHEVLEAMEAAIPLVLLLAGGGGFWLASVGLRPIAAMAQRAVRIPPTGMEDLGHTERKDELGQFARAFNGLVARLRTALRTQQQFMADASHELRTPVSVVRAASEVALSRDHRDEGEYRESLAIVGDQARRLSRLVDHMLVLARADAGGHPLRPVDLYLDEVVGECVLALRALSTERQVAIRAAPSPEVPCRADEDLLRQLLMNVMQNAVQHTPPGGTVLVTIERREGFIDVRVADTGPGIAPADQARIFDRFVQLDDARRGSGAGLGLPIARWIAGAHGGALTLEASSPAGSTFCVSLPAGVAAAVDSFV
jgi:two-component system, OmpR family, sensor kinase